MQATTWQEHLRAALKNNTDLSFTHWINRLTESVELYRELYQDFLKAVWQAESNLLDEKDFLVNLVGRDGEVFFIEDLLQTPSDLQELLVQAFERIPPEVHDRMLPVYEEVLLDFYLDRPASAPAFQLFKAFLAKTRVGVSLDFSQSCRRRFQDDLDFKMDLVLLAVIRDDAKGRTESLARWEEWLLRRVDNCIDDANARTCDPALRFLVPLAYIWRLQKPDKLIEKCIQLEYKWPRKPKEQVLTHMAIYVRQAIVQLCHDGQMEALVKFKTGGIKGWVEELFIKAFSHPKLEEIAQKMAVYEEDRMKILQNKTQEEIVNRLEKITRE